jgi:hypothetical protein
MDAYVTAVNKEGIGQGNILTGRKLRPLKWLGDVLVEWEILGRFLAGIKFFFLLDTRPALRRTQFPVQ